MKGSCRIVIRQADATLLHCEARAHQNESWFTAAMERDKWSAFGDELQSLLTMMSRPIMSIDQRMLSSERADYKLAAFTRLQRREKSAGDIRVYITLLSRN